MVQSASIVLTYCNKTWSHDPYVADICSTYIPLGSIHCLQGYDPFNMCVRQAYLINLGERSCVG